MHQPLVAGQGIAPDERAAALLADMRSGGRSSEEFASGIAQTQKTIEVMEAISDCALTAGSETRAGNAGIAYAPLGSVCSKLLGESAMRKKHLVNH